MGECFIDYTVINSQPSEDRLTELLDALVSTFGLEESAEDLFWHGVFFKPQNYVNYEFDYDGIDFEVPSALCSDPAAHRYELCPASSGPCRDGGVHQYPSCLCRRKQGHIHFQGIG